MGAIRMLLVGLVLAMPAVGAQATVGLSPEIPPGHSRAIAAAVEEFEAATGHRAGCIGEANIEFAELPGRGGEYRSGSALVVVDDDVPVSRLRLVVIHELAHHAMISCDLHNDPAFKARFFTAGDLERDRSWFDYSLGWSNAPAELFAEAFTQVIAGRSAHGEDIPPVLVETVQEWLDHPVAAPAVESPASEAVVGRRAVGIQPLLGSRRTGSSRPSRFGR